MTASAVPPLSEALGLLERAVDYTRGVLAEVRPHHLGLETPCTGWDLGRLLDHMDDSLAALTEAADLGRVSLVGVAGGSSVPVVERLRLRACGLLAAWVRAEPGAVRVGGDGAEVGLDLELTARVGALDVAVHGWDVSASLGPGRPVPSGLAHALLGVAHRVVDPGDGSGRFAVPLPAPRDASASDRLLAHLGRSS